MDAIILAGGKGSRMDSLLPKALVEAKGKPIIIHQLEYLINSVDNITLSLGYKANEVSEYVKNNFNSSSIDFSVEDEPLGTAGALKKSLQKANSDTVLVLNCDDITNINLNDLFKRKENTICVAHPKLPFGLVTSYNGYAEFIEKPVLNSWASCGWYLLKKDLDSVLPDKGSLEYDVFPKQKMRIFYHEEIWIPLNTKKDIEEFEK